MLLSCSASSLTFSMAVEDAVRVVVVVVSPIVVAAATVVVAALMGLNFGEEL